MSHYNKKCPIDIENYGAIGPSTLSSFLITERYVFNCTCTLHKYRGASVSMHVVMELLSPTIDCRSVCKIHRTVGPDRQNLLRSEKFSPETGPDVRYSFDFYNHLDLLNV